MCKGPVSLQGPRRREPRRKQKRHMKSLPLHTRQVHTCSASFFRVPEEKGLRWPTTEGINEDTPLRDEKGQLVTHTMTGVKYGAESHGHQSACSGRFSVSRLGSLGVQGPGSQVPWGRGQKEAFRSDGNAPCLARGGSHSDTTGKKSRSRTWKTRGILYHVQYTRRKCWIQDRQSLPCLERKLPPHPAHLTKSGVPQPARSEVRPGGGKPEVPPRAEENPPRPHLPIIC